MFDHLYTSDSRIPAFDGGRKALVQVRTNASHGIKGEAIYVAFDTGHVVL
jgi:hypothetical protein